MEGSPEFKFSKIAGQAWLFRSDTHGMAGDWILRVPLTGELDMLKEVSTSGWGLRPVLAEKHNQYMIRSDVLLPNVAGLHDQT